MTQHDLFSPAHTMASVVSFLTYRQTSQGNMTQFFSAVINTMMSL